MSGLALAAALPQARRTPPLRLLRIREAQPAYGNSDPQNIPDLFDDADALEALGDEIATLAARGSANEQKILALIADFDRRRGWELGGHRSCAYWLAYRTKMDLHSARERVRAARLLSELPETNAGAPPAEGGWSARGELSFSSVRALTRVATAENEEDLLELARGCTTARAPTAESGWSERVVRAFRIGGAKDEAARERVMHQARSLSVFPGDDGMHVVNGRLTPEVGALLMRAIEAGSDALYRERHVPGTPAEETARAARRLRVDALGLLAERALGVGFGSAQGAAGAGDTGESVPAGTPGADSASPGGVDGPVAETEGNVPAGTPAANPAKPGGPCGSDGPGGADAPDGRDPETDEDVPAGTPDTSPAPISGTRAERYQVMLHVEPATLSADHTADDPGDDSPAGRSNLHDGTRLAAETSRRIACDAAVVRVDHGEDGAILSVGRRTRSIPPALRRALEVRDRGCRFPDHSPPASGARGLRFTDAHHLLHWADGGETSLANTLLLCRHHHRLVHEDGWQVQWWGEGRPVFFDPRGGAHYDGRWQPPTLRGRGNEAPSGRGGGALPNGMPHRLRTDGPRSDGPDAWTASARWKREEDIPDAVLFRAMEALGD